MNLAFMKSQQGADPVVMESEFAASPQRVFRAWTTPEDIKQWFGAGDGGPETALVDLKEGGEWEFTFAEKDGQTDSLKGQYTKIEVDKRLEFTWVHVRTNADGNVEQSAESLVVVELEVRSSGTFIRLTHSSVVAESSRSNIGGGWSMSLSKMKGMVE